MDQWVFQCTDIIVGVFEVMRICGERQGYNSLSFTVALDFILDKLVPLLKNYCCDLQTNKTEKKTPEIVV